MHSTSSRSCFDLDQSELLRVDCAGVREWALAPNIGKRSLISAQIDAALEHGLPRERYSFMIMQMMQQEPPQPPRPGEPPAPKPGPAPDGVPPPMPTPTPSPPNPFPPQPVS